MVTARRQGWQSRQQGNGGGKQALPTGGHGDVSSEDGPSGDHPQVVAVVSAKGVASAER